MFYAQDLHEHVTALDVFNVKQEVVYSVPIANIKAGDVLRITSEMEATNNNQFNVMIGSSIVLADSPYVVKGTLIDAANAYNITPGMHHGIVTKARNWQAQSSYSNKYLNLVAWAASVNSILGQVLIIEQRYGHLDAYIS